MKKLAAEKLIPQKLKKDAIAEAIFELRFDCDESPVMPEIVVAKLAGNPTWKDYKPTRLGVADIPPQIRLRDPNLKYQAVLELKGDNGRRVVKIGTNSFSYHALAPYPGWPKLKPEIESAIDFVLGQLPHFVGVRLGLRYQNLMTKADHGISELADLDFSVAIEGQTLSEPMFLNYAVKHAANHGALVRVSSPDFVAGAKTTFSALIDVDVSTPSDFKTSDGKFIKSWVENAHGYEKEDFFSLLTPETINALKED